MSTDARKRRSTCHSPSRGPRCCDSEGNTDILGPAPQEKQVKSPAIIKFLLTTKSAGKKLQDNNILVFIVDVKANKHQIKQAVKELDDIDGAKVSSLIRPVGDKQAYV
ncbi:60S ribosomal protein L23a [Galemys pyrenaicus]|uniref:60S ribosomal protein L23a n=1 Tax=Galemys pyrenaicus TaxID=202257 RepID=A0A8J6ACA8_GALPY|nr:60S ribosomal protein L23a [Galemys pyrenaicus]